MFPQGVPHPRAEKSQGSFHGQPCNVHGFGFCWDKLFPSCAGSCLGSAQVEVLLQEENLPPGNPSTRDGTRPRLHWRESEGEKRQETRWAYNNRDNLMLLAWYFLTFPISLFTKAFPVFQRIYCEGIGSMGEGKQIRGFKITIKYLIFKPLDWVPQFRREEINEP